MWRRTGSGLGALLLLMAAHIGSVSGTAGSGTAFAAPAALAPAAVTLDKVVTKQQTTRSTTVTTPTFSTAAANELLLAFVAADGPSASSSQRVTGVTGGGLTWTLRQRVNTQAGTSEIWQAAAPSTLTNATVRATLSSSHVSMLSVAAFRVQPCR